MLLSLAANASVEIDGVYYELDSSTKTAEVVKNPNKYNGGISIPSTITYEGDEYDVTSIHGNAFRNCEDLVFVVIGEKVASIGNYSFRNCDKLTNVWAFMQNPPAIIKETFTNRTNAILHVPTGSVTAYKSAAYWKEFKSIVATNNGIINFADANIKALCVANWDTDNDGELSEFEALKITDIGTVFSENTAIISFNELSYFSNLENIEANAFKGCSNLGSITIPKSVESIGTDAFAGCNNITTVTIQSNAVLSNYPDWGKSSLSTIFGEQVQEYILEEGITRIGRNAFYGCNGLTYITIPNSVTSIGDYAFYGCNSLVSVNIPSAVELIGDFAFDGCNSLTAVHISNLETWVSINFASATSNPLYYGHHLYLNNEEVKYLVIPNNVKTINRFAFIGCYSLSSLLIPKSVTYIGEFAFQFCNLSSIAVEEGNTIYDSRNNCNAIIETASNTLIRGSQNTVIPQTVKTLKDGAFNGCTGLTTITIPSSVTLIEEHVFWSCLDLTSISVEEGNTVYDSRNNCNAIIETASNTLLYGCKNAQIPNGTTTIETYAFGGISDLSYVTIPNSVTTIRNEAFYGCSGLTSLVIPNSVTKIGVFAFAWCSGLTSIQVEDGNTVYDSRNNCNAIIETATNTLAWGCQNTKIPNGITTIGENSFSGCTGLTYIIIPSSITSIGYRAFGYCTNLTDMYCYAEQVPKTDSYSFSDSNYTSATLHVPAGSVEAYSNAEYWKDFGSIVALTENDPKPTGIANVANKNTSKHYFSLDGKRLATPQRGLNIIKMSDGTTKKIVIK